MAQEVALQPKYNLPRMKSVERISKLPAVEQTVDMANHLYVRVKDTNNLVKTVLTTAETTVKGAVDITLPVTSKLERPIKMMDSFLCSSLDYVETKIPAVKLPLDEMYKNTRDSLYTIPGVKCACQAGEQSVKKAVEMAYGATQYGTQKFKDVKDCFTLSSEDPKANAFAVQTSLTAKRLFFLLFSWLWVSKPQLTETKPPVSHGANSVEGRKVESEGNAENNTCTVSAETDTGKATSVLEGKEKENHASNHTKSE